MPIQTIIRHAKGDWEYTISSLGDGTYAAQIVGPGGNVQTAKFTSEPEARIALADAEANKNKLVDKE
jgi:hypothetical protein